jgi:tRNA A-37 threonylcarbamoyl transferase component Bud32
MQLYFVNWQREVSVEELNGQKVVVKRNKPTKEFHEFLLISLYSLISMLLVHPSAPPAFSEIMRNEGRDMRKNLEKMGISTPKLISISDIDLVEEYIEGGDLYMALVSGQPAGLAFDAGCLTGRMHKSGYAFVDNKAQNYLVRGDSVVRTDLGFIQKSNSHYARSMDIGSFLASVMDLGRYRAVEKAFFDGYMSESHRKFSCISIVIRNVLSLGLSSDSRMTLKNLLLDATMLINV